MAEMKTCPSCGAQLAPDALQGLCPACLLKEAMASNPASGPTIDVPPEAAKSGADLTATPAERFAAPAIADLAKHFPQLEIQTLLGKGGMGAVYKARQVALDRMVALKILPPESGRDPHFAERFTREARALARLNHSHITTVYEFGESGGYFFFLMEYVDGVNLRQALRSKTMTPEQALAIVPQICDALQYAHDEGIVHRDIKPENILIDKKGRVKIADFGLAKLLNKSESDRTLTGAGQAMGTLHYMAPEQLENPLAVDHRADVYSLGVVFYEMLTGELPLGRFQLPSHKAQVDVRLDEVVLKSLEHERERRYQHVSEVKTELQNISGTTAQYAKKMPESAAGASLPPKSGTTNVAAPVAKPLPPATFDLVQRIKLIATLLLIAGVINVAATILAVPLTLTTRGGHDLLYVGGTAFVLSVLIIFGATQMRRIQSWEFSLITACLALAPEGPASILAFPVAIWALIVLSKKEAKELYRENAQRLNAGDPNAPPFVEAEKSGGNGSNMKWAIFGFVALAGFCLITPAMVFLYFFVGARDAKMPRTNNAAAIRYSVPDFVPVIARLPKQIAELKGAVRASNPAVSASLDGSFTALETSAQQLQALSSAKPAEALPPGTMPKASDLLSKASLALSEIAGSNTTQNATYAAKAKEVERSLDTLTANADAIAAISETDFRALLTRIQNQAFDENKFDILRPAVSRYRFTSAQAKTIVSAFSFEKANCVRLLYPRATDPANYFHVLDAVTFPNERQELQKELGL